MKEGGFSIVELVLTILLLGLIVAVVPPLVPVSQEGLDGGARKVRADLVYLQQRAMITGQNHGGVFTPGGYELYQVSPATPIVDVMTKELFSVTHGARELARFGNNVVVLGNYQVEFDSIGRPVLGGGETLTLSNGTATRSIFINRNTGLVEMP